MLGTILIVVLLLLLLGAWPAWPYSNGWGYYPSGTLGLVLVVVLVLAIALTALGHSPTSTVGVLAAAGAVGLELTGRLLRLARSSSGHEAC